MKKIWNVGICTIAAAMLLAGCSKSDKTDTTAASAAESTAAGETEEYVAEGSVKLGKYKGVEVTIAKADATDEEIDAQIQQILKANAENVAVEREAKLGDVVNIDYKGIHNGEAFEGGTAEGYDLELGSGGFIDGFEDGLVGVKKGDKKDLNLTFPDPYQNNPALAGEAVVFEVTVNSVMEKVIPEFNDAFVKKISPQDGTAEAYKQVLRDSITEQKKYDIETQRNIDLMEAIMSDSEIVCATDAVDAEYEAQLAQFTSQAGMYGIAVEDMYGIYGMDEAGFKAELRELAKDVTKQKMVYEEIAKNENIAVTDEDRTNLAKANGFETADELIAAYSEDEVRVAALAQKVLDFLLENAVITTADAAQ